MRKTKFISIVVCLFTFLFFAGYSAADELIGITWCGKYEKQKMKKDKYGNKLISPKPSELISFNPVTGTIKKKFLQFDKKECFRGLAYDSKSKKLYALSQVNWNLYSIDPGNRQTKLIGKLDIESLPLGKNTWGKDIGGLTYDPGSKVFYTSVSHWSSDQTNIWSELVTFDLRKPARVKSIGKNKDRMIEVRSVGVIACKYISSISFNKDDGLIYAFAVDKSGSWDSLNKSRLVTINPGDAAIRKDFEITLQCGKSPPAKVHTILGLALTPVKKTNTKTKPQENIFYSWINWDSHFYARCDLDRQNMKTTCKCLKNSDLIGVNSDAMLLNPF